MDWTFKQGHLRPVHAVERRASVGPNFHQAKGGGLIVHQMCGVIPRVFAYFRHGLLCAGCVVLISIALSPAVLTRVFPSFPVVRTPWVFWQVALRLLQYLLLGPSIDCDVVFDKLCFDKPSFRKVLCVQRAYL